MLNAVSFAEELSPEEIKGFSSLTYDFALVCYVHLYTSMHVAARVFVF